MCFAANVTVNMLYQSTIKVNLGQNTIFRCPHLNSNSWVFFGRRWNVKDKVLFLETNTSWPKNVNLLHQNKLVYILESNYDNVGNFLCYVDNTKMFARVELKIIGKEVGIGGIGIESCKLARLNRCERI